MKKILTIIIASILLSIPLSIPFSAEVATAAGCENDSKCPSGLQCIDGTCNNPIFNLLPRPGKTNELKYDELSAIKNLPEVTSESFIKTIIKTILGASMLLTIIATIVAAVYYIKSQGQEEDISKAKNIILYLVIGMAIMAAAYGIVSGIVQFKFFDAP